MSRQYWRVLPERSNRAAGPEWREREGPLDRSPRHQADRLQPDEQRADLHRAADLLRGPAVPARGDDTRFVCAACEVLLPGRARSALRPFAFGRGAGEAARAPRADRREHRLRLQDLEWKARLATASRLRRRHAGLHPDAEGDADRRAAGPLSVSTSDGETLVNYRVKGRFYIVDKLFDEAHLRAGVGWKQDEVKIRYTGKRGS